MTKRTQSLLKKATAAVLCLCTALAIGPVPQALAQARAAVEFRAGGATVNAPVLGPSDIGLNAGSLSPVSDVSVTPLAESAFVTGSLPAANMDRTAATLSAPSAVSLAAVAQVQPNAAQALRAEPPAAPAIKRDAPRVVEAAGEDSASGQANAAARKELGGVHDAVAALPDAAEVGAGQAYANGRSLSDLITHQRARNAEGDTAVPTASSLEASPSGLARELSEAAQSRLSSLVPLPEKAAAPRRNGAPYRAAIAITAMVVVAGLIVVSQAYIPAIISSLSLMLLAGTVTDESPKPARSGAFSAALAELKPLIEVTALLGASVGLSWALVAGLAFPAWLAGILGTGAAAAGYVALKRSGADLWASFTKSNALTVVKAAAGAAAGVGAAALLALGAAVASPWLSLALGAGAAAAGLAALILPASFSLRNVVEGGVTAALGLGLGAALLLTLGLAPWLAGLLGVSAAAGAVNLQRFFAAGGGRLDLAPTARKAAMLGAGAALTGAVLLAASVATPWLALPLGLAAGLLGLATLRLPGALERGIKAPKFAWLPLLVGAASVKVSVVLALALLGLGVAPWLAGLLGVGVAAAGASILRVAVFGSRSRQAAQAAAVRAAQAVRPGPGASPDAAPDPELKGQIQKASEAIARLKAEIGTVIVGQEQMVDYVIMALLSGQHVLLEGVPGVAKTTAIKAFAAAMGADFQHYKRIQGTPDKMPADIIGTEFIQEDLQTGLRKLALRKGPIFAAIVLFDEINRAPAKTQAALLEAMQERQVTIGDETLGLPKPFLLLATQNPIEHEGVYPLTQAAQDRFMFKVIVPMPTDSEMLRISRSPDGQAKQVTTIEEMVEAGKLAKKIHIDPSLEEYIVNLVRATHYPWFYEVGKPGLVSNGGGASPRAGIFLRMGAKIRALMQGRDYVTPDDIRAVAPEILRHRVRLGHEAGDFTTDQLVRALLEKMPTDGAAARAMREKSLVRHAKELPREVRERIVAEIEADAALAQKVVSMRTLEEEKNQQPSRWVRWGVKAGRIAVQVLKWALFTSPLWLAVLAWLFWPTLTAHFPVLNDWLTQARTILGR